MKTEEELLKLAKAVQIAGRVEQARIASERTAQQVYVGQHRAK